MSLNDQVSQSFSRAYNDVRKLYDQDKLDECVAACQDLLEDPDLPRYHRIKTLILLASCLDEWGDVETCRQEAEALWQLAHRYYETEGDFEAKQALEELRQALDELQKRQVEEAPVATDTLSEMAAEEQLEDPRAVAEAEREVFGEGLEDVDEEAEVERVEAEMEMDVEGEGEGEGEGGAQEPAGGDAAEAGQQGGALPSMQFGGPAEVRSGTALEQEMERTTLEEQGERELKTIEYRRPAEAV